MESGWSLKQLHRLIVGLGDLSAVVARDAGAAAPAIRTTACSRAARGSASTPRSCATSRWRPAACSTPRSAGRASSRRRPRSSSCRPASYGPKVWNEATGAERYRRALYTFRYRSVPYPMLQTFDAPNGDFACVRRARSNTPLQALTTLNEPVFLECARALALRRWSKAAKRRRRHGSTTPSAAAWRERRPTRRNRPCSTCLRKQTRRFERPGADPWELAAGDPKQRRRAAGRRDSRQELAGWTAVARVLLNLDETITKE